MRLHALTFRDGRLAAGGVVQRVALASGASVFVVSPADEGADLSVLPVAPLEADVLDLLRRQEGSTARHAMKFGWSAPEWLLGPAGARRELRPGAWLVCLGVDAVPEDAVAFLGGERDVVERMLAAAGVRLELDELPRASAEGRGPSGGGIASEMPPQPRQVASQAAGAPHAAAAEAPRGWILWAVLLATLVNAALLAALILR